MIGKPKYSHGQVVKFKVQDETKEGVIAIIDKWGTFEDNSDVSYDILVGDENCLYKHIREDYVV
jgi:hypothetical protein